MLDTRIGASPGGVSLAVPPARLGLINPATRFRKLLPYIGTALVLTTAISGYATMKGMAASRGWLGGTIELKSELGNLELNHGLLHRYAAEAAAGGNEVAEDQVRSTADAMRQSLARLRQLTRDDAAQQELLGRLEPIAERHIQELRAATGALTLAKSPRHLPAVESKGETEEDATISHILGDVNTRETQLLAVRQAAWDREFGRNIAVLAFAVGACLLLLITNMHLLRVDARSSRVAAEHIRESADSYRALSARIIGLQDSERRRIGRELHDSVGQSLAALQMNLDRLSAAQKAAGGVGPLVAECLDLVRRTAQDVRTISYLLHPPLLDVVGFAAAARNYLQQFERRSGIKVNANVPEDLKLPSKEAELVAFRVLQESLTNVHRHAQASAVDVWLARRGNEVALTIQDNGRGLPAGVMENFSAGLASGVGLAGMRERLAEFGGTLAVETSHSGTMVRASIPG
jgi:signal transduction histidine kinase